MATTTTELWQRWRSAVVALAAGAMLPLAFAPFGLYPLSVVAMLLLFAVWLHGDWRRNLRDGLFFGLGLFGVGVSWVFVAVHVFGETGVVAAALFTALFIVLLALFPASLGGCIGLLRARLRPTPAASLLLLLPATWVLWEWLRSWFFTGFPWLSLGYAHSDAPLIGLAPLGGVFAVSWAVAFTAGGLLWLWVSREDCRPMNRIALVLIVLWAGSYLLAQKEWSEADGEPLEVSLIQGNIAQEVRWDDAWFQHTLDLYAELTLAERGRDLIVWPENAIPIFYDQLRDSYYRPLAARLAESGSELLAGMPVFLPETGRYYNSLVRIGEAPAFYHKRHLVPFGEYVPLEGVLRGLIGFFDLPMSAFAPGHHDDPPTLEVAGVEAGLSICYEDLFGHRFRHSAAAGILINASNNAWYGDSLAPHQHLQISRLRAIETARPLLRATTNGISAVIDPDGTVRLRSPQFEQHVLRAEAQPQRGTTPYVRHGDGPLLILLLLALAALLLPPLRRRDTLA